MRAIRDQFMKNIFCILLLTSTSVIAQTLTSKEISKYVKTIDSLRVKKNALKKVAYSNMSFCGGGLTGYYYENHLVFIKAVYQGELGYTEQKVYLIDTIPYKLTYRQHYAEWNKYYSKFPDRDKEFDAAKMTYSDTLYYISFTNPIKVSKTSKKKYIGNKMEKNLVDNIVECIKTMYAELESEKANY